MVFAFSKVANNHSEGQTKETDLPVIRPPSSRLTLASKLTTIKFTGLGVRNMIGPMLGSFLGIFSDQKQMYPSVCRYWNDLSVLKYLY
jgi:hypothetical protein